MLRSVHAEGRSRYPVLRRWFLSNRREKSVPTPAAYVPLGGAPLPETPLQSRRRLTNQCRDLYRSRFLFATVGRKRLRCLR